jgi:predicted CoA-substrate-specific enzyme activase
MVSYLGIDVGSSYIKIWHEDHSGSVIASRNIHHRGSPQTAVLHELKRLSINRASLCFSGNLGGQGLAKIRKEGLLAEIDLLKNIYPHRHLLIFGAEKIELVSFDETGRVLHYQTNPACAAGTGSFLDEQMLRLGLEFSDIPSVAIDDAAPMVATRCAVFAKTDLIHLQQEGQTQGAMYNGLCKGLVLSSLKSVFGGKLTDGSHILATGGLLENLHIRHFLKKIFPRITIAETPAFTRARGLCFKARSNGYRFDCFMKLLQEQTASTTGENSQRPLELIKSIFPSHEMERSTDEYSNEVWHNIKDHETLDVYLGVDIGSTSTKAVLVDGTSNIRLDIYTRTSGNPIEAARRIFISIISLQEKLHCSIRIKGCGTTGSGRKLVGSVIGADLIINEISAHAKGAMTLDAHVETIFEIGGQDAKFIRLESGRITDVNMNYVCAAGTGSFVEEQARTLGMSLDEIGDRVMGVTPLPNSDRCTVFMNQEITRQLSSGHKKEEIMAGVLLAVFKNYINRVVGNRRYSTKSIVFQGATARNKGLVAALEQITGTKIMVSPFCHVMGAFGAALLTRDKLASQTSFRGFHLPEVQVKERVCKGCENTCRITMVQVGSDKTSWGYMCGREPGTSPLGRKPNPCMEIREELLDEFRDVPWDKGRSFKMPALGLNEEFIPLLKEIALACRFNIELCYPDKDEILKELTSMGLGDFCYPIKVSMASVNILLKKDPSCSILLPFLIQDEQDPAVQPRSLYCPFITALPGFFKELPKRIFTPLIDLSRSISWQARQVRDFLMESDLPPTPLHRIKKALEKGISELRKYRSDLSAKSKTILDEIPGDQKVIVLMGRPYNLYHRILNLGIPELIESLGYKVVTMDAVLEEVTNQDVVALFPDMYWFQGQRLLRKALTIRNRPNLFPLMISNFSCGPDSFILSYIEEVFQDKPYLILELDEHGSATGYQTRIEAFIDMIEQYRESGDSMFQPRKSAKICYNLEDIKEKTRIWIPQIHPYIPQLWSATLKRFGYDTYATGEETTAECAAGRARCRGSECLPAAVTTGKFLSLAKEAPPDCVNVLFMPRAEGPCRFGQYATLQSMILNREGLEKTRIFSPTSENGYSFLTPEMELQVWKAICLGDALYKLRCRTMPYHRDPAEAEALFSEILNEIGSRILAGREYRSIITRLVKRLRTEVAFQEKRKPLVGIVGEIFVRLNTFSNQHIAEVIEAHGGEAWLSPLSEWIHYVWDMLAKRSSLFKKPSSYFKKYFLHAVEKDIMDLFSPVLDDRHEPSIEDVLERGASFIPLAFEGESILTIGRAKVFAEQGASLIVNCSPFSCMPGRITNYIFQNYHEYFQVPVVNLVFDGIGDISSQVGFYLKSITEGDARRQSTTYRHTLPSSKKRGSPSEGRYMHEVYTEEESNT